jgi:hypothetical protein
LSELPRDVSRVVESDIAEYVNWIDQHGVSPLDYLVGKCRQHEIVVLGEAHEVSDHLIFLAESLAALYKNAGVRYLGLEVCNAEDNDSIERLITAREYDRQLALEIARRQNWGIWGFKEYWDLLEAAWNLNSDLPTGEKRMRVIGIDRRVDLCLFYKWQMGMAKNESEIEQAKELLPIIRDRDLLMAEQVENEIIGKGDRGIVLVGGMHAHTHYRQPKIDENRECHDDLPGRMAYILRERHDDEIFAIMLYFVGITPKLVDPEYPHERAKMTDFLDMLMERRGSVPIAFDLHVSPLANLRDETSYYFHYQPEVVFGDVCRGYIFFKPWRELKRCAWIDGFIRPEFFARHRDYFEKTRKRIFASVEELEKVLAVQTEFGSV